MRVFVFFLMMAVTFAGVLGGFRLITGKDLIGLSEFGVGRASATSAAPVGTATPRAGLTPAPTAIPIPTPVPPTPTPAPDAARTMVVANTEGQGVYVRRTPKLDDKLRAWVEGTKMQVTGSPVEGDGVQWLKVKSPDGAEGYLPQQYLAPAP